MPRQTKSSGVYVMSKKVELKHKHEWLQGDILTGKLLNSEECDCKSKQFTDLEITAYNILLYYTPFINAFKLCVRS